MSGNSGLRNLTLCSLLLSTSCGGIRIVEGEKGTKISAGSATITLSDEISKPDISEKVNDVPVVSDLPKVKYYPGYGDIRDNLDWYAKILLQMPGPETEVPIDEHIMRKFLDEWTYIPAHINEKNAQEYNRSILVGRSYDYTPREHNVVGKYRMFTLHVTMDYVSVASLQFFPSEKQFAMLEARKDFKPSNNAK